MNSYKQMPFKNLVMLLCLINTAAFGQKQTKTYNELFNVNAETVLDISTNNADIEFETWDKNQIAIEAVIELEGASQEEAEAYFQNAAMNIQGNSKRVEISTGTENTWLWDRASAGHDNINFDGNFSFEIDSLYTGLPSVDFDHIIFDMDAMDELPPIPPVPSPFDYEAFKEDGEKYLKEWQEEFSKGFDKEYEERLAEWAERVAERAKAKKDRLKEREARLKKRNAQQLKRMEEREKSRAKMEKKRLEALEKRLDARAKARESRTMIFHERRQHEAPNIFYISSDNGHKNYKVKKTIKIKMPKGNKIQMNVRHGEVKLAENTKNINANLSYSNLNAFTIDGKETTIVASYSPIVVMKWNNGQLQADYSDKVDLREVTDLRLRSTSSDVTIDRLLKKAHITNKFGPLQVNYVSKDFDEIDISLQNAELFCETPKASFSIYVKGTSSKFTAPADVKLEQTKNANTIVHKGYSISKNNDKSIIINSKYSDVVFN